MCVSADNFLFFGYSSLVLKKACIYVQFLLILIDYWKHNVFNDDLALHLHLYFIISSLECQIIIRDHRTGYGRWAFYVFMRGGEGEGSFAGFGLGFFFQT